MTLLAVRTGRAAGALEDKLIHFFWGQYGKHPASRFKNQKGGGGGLSDSEDQFIYLLVFDPVPVGQKLFQRPSAIPSAPFTALTFDSLSGNKRKRD